MLSGIDACVSLSPISVAAERAGDLVTVLRNDGKTGAHYKGPEGSGEGHTIAWTDPSGAERSLTPVMVEGPEDPADL